jgi:hypothetical protein
MAVIVVSNIQLLVVFTGIFFFLDLIDDDETEPVPVFWENKYRYRDVLSLLFCTFTGIVYRIFQN